MLFAVNFLDDVSKWSAMELWMGNIGNLYRI
jgi:hypothetical protein